MKLQKILRSNLGFSMVEISVAMGLMGLATLAVMNLSDQVNTSTKRAESMLSKSQFASSLGNYLYSASACEEMQGMPAFTATASPIKLDKWKILGDGEQVVQGVESGKKFRNFKLKTLEASMDTTGAPTISIDNKIHARSFLNVRAVIEVKLNPKLHEDDPQGKKAFEYFFNIPVLAENGVVRFCNEQKTIQETCVAMKGEFINGICELEKTCNIQGTYTTLSCMAGQTCNTSGGSAQPNPLNNNQPGCPNGVTAVQTGTKTWSHIGTCSGKKCNPPTVTNTLAYWTCLDCPGMTSGGGGSTGGGSYGGGGGGGCFVAGTEVQMYGGGVKNIEDVVIGDLLVDHRGFETEVKKLLRYDHQGKVYSINGGAYFFTANHPFLSTDGWKSLDPKKTMSESPELKVTMLKVGDVLLKRNGQEVIKSLDYKISSEKVYNFTLNNSHEFIAEDFAVHNKQAFQ